MIKRTERGWAGHFIRADECLFRRNTLLEKGKTRVVVSTVGAQRLPTTGEIDTIGHNRYYETMAFMAQKEGLYWEVDNFRRVSFESEWALDKWEDHDIDIQANNMHEAVVDEITTMIKKGECK